MLLNWNDLKILLAIADNGSLSGAARQLQLNHSTVFRRLNALESDLNVRLFDRVQGGYTLTPAGERMLQLSREAQVVMQNIELELAGQDVSPSGTVRLTTAANIARTLLVPVLKSLRNTYPQIVVEIAVGDSDYDLNRREADIALRATGKPPPHLIGRRVMDLDWWICGATRDRGRQPRNLRELHRADLIGADRSLHRVEAYRWLEDNYKDNIVARANDLSTMAAMAMAGVGLALLPSDQQERRLRRLFRAPGMRGELWLLTHPDLRNVRRIRVVWDAIHEALRQTPPASP